MNCNVGGIDRMARIIGGLIVLAIGIVVPMATLWQTLLLIIGTVALVTGIIRFCPANALFGINTCGGHTRVSGSH